MWMVILIHENDGSRQMCMYGAGQTKKLEYQIQKLCIPGHDLKLWEIYCVLIPCLVQDSHALTSGTLSIVVPEEKFWEFSSLALMNMIHVTVILWKWIPITFMKLSPSPPSPVHILFVTNIFIFRFLLLNGCR